jgi:hypothetical protein
MRILQCLSLAVVALSTTTVYAGDQPSNTARTGGTPWQQLALIEPPVMHAATTSLNAVAIETCTSYQGCIIPERLPAPAATASVELVGPVLEAASEQLPSKNNLPMLLSGQ